MVDVVSRHVKLARKGRNHWGLCPFHKEKSPSFSVAADKGLYKCFGCGEAGDAIGFLMKLERKAYPEVIRDAADAMGILIAEKFDDTTEAGINRAVLLALNAAAQGYFEAHLAKRDLPEAEALRQTLRERGFQRSLAHCKFGYAPDNKQGLLQHLSRSGEFTEIKNLPEALVEAGLLIEKVTDSGQKLYFDRFRHRLMIPITDAQDRIVAFGGRAIAPESSPNGLPKYMNSPETRLYQKSSTLFGFSVARKAIAQAQHAVVMEGYFDVLSANRHGVLNVVASCGTALTEQQAKKLAQAGAQTIYLCFDGDAAGTKAALSAIERLSGLLGRYEAHQERLTLKVLRLPAPHKDPDEFFRAYETSEAAQAAWHAVLTQAQEAMAFKCDQAIAGLDLETVEGRLEAAHQLVPVLATLPNAVIRQQYSALYAERCGVSAESLQEDIVRYGQQQPKIESFAPRNVNNRNGLATFKLQDAFSNQSDVPDRTPGTNRPVMSPVTTPSQSAFKSASNPMQPMQASGSSRGAAKKPVPLKPINRLRAAEETLLQLLLMNTASLQAFYPRLAPIRFFEQDLAAVFAAVSQAVAAVGQASVTLQTLIQHAGDALRDQPDVYKTFSGVLFTSGELAESLAHQRRPGMAAGQAANSLATLPPAAQKAFNDALNSHAHAQQHMAAYSPLMTQDAAQNQGQALKAQYDLREKLPATMLNKPKVSILHAHITSNLVSD